MLHFLDEAQEGNKLCKNGDQTCLERARKSSKSPNTPEGDEKICQSYLCPQEGYKWLRDVESPCNFDKEILTVNSTSTV